MSKPFCSTNERLATFQWGSDHSHWSDYQYQPLRAVTTVYLGTENRDAVNQSPYEPISFGCLHPTFSSPLFLCLSLDALRPREYEYILKWQERSYWSFIKWMRIFFYIMLKEISHFALMPKNHIHFQVPFFRRCCGLLVGCALRVREVRGSIPPQAISLPSSFGWDVKPRSSLCTHA